MSERGDQEMDGAEKTCPVCQDQLQDPAQLPCNHEFCQTCLLRSLDYRRHCPLCRKPVSEDYLSTAVPNQTRRARVRHGRTRDRISTLLETPAGPFVSAGLSNQNNQRRAHLNLSRFPSAAGFPYVSLIPTATPVPAPALTPPTLPLFPVPSNIAAQSARLGLLTRLLQNYTTPRVNVQDPLDLSATENENEEIQNLLIEQVQAEQRETLPNNSVRVFACPYCQQGDLDELALRDHCNTLHHHDLTRVVCPVCVALPHGDENYYSRNFIAHLNLRHSYFSEDITNTHQSDAMNMQAAILESLRS